MTTKEKIFNKLTSRKLWVAIAGLVAMIMIYCGADEDSVNQICAIIMGGAIVLGYIIGEGLVDAEDASGDTYIEAEEDEVIESVDDPDEAEG